MMNAHSQVAWVVGATGLVGGELVAQLANSTRYTKVVALVRNTSKAEWSRHPKVTQVSVDFNDLANSIPNELMAQGADALFCALGSTKKKTPDPEKYYQIDVGYPLAFAELGKQCGARFYGVVSAHGANTKSLSSYLRMKGEMEAQLCDLSYAYTAIARPGLLMGERGEFRKLEKLAELVTKHLPGNYRAIAAADVAAALIHASSKDSCKQASKVVKLSSANMQGAYQGQ